LTEEAGQERVNLEWREERGASEERISREEGMKKDGSVIGREGIG